MSCHPPPGGWPERPGLPGPLPEPPRYTVRKAVTHVVLGFGVTFLLLIAEKLAGGLR